MQTSDSHFVHMAGRKKKNTGNYIQVYKHFLMLAIYKI